MNNTKKCINMSENISFHKIPPEELHMPIIPDSLIIQDRCDQSMPIRHKTWNETRWHSAFQLPPRKTRIYGQFASSIITETLRLPWETEADKSKTEEALLLMISIGIFVEILVCFTYNRGVTRIKQSEH